MEGKTLRGSFQEAIQEPDAVRIGDGVTIEEEGLKREKMLSRSYSRKTYTVTRAKTTTEEVAKYGMCRKVLRRGNTEKGTPRFPSNAWEGDVVQKQWRAPEPIR